MPPLAPITLPDNFGIPNEDTQDPDCYVLSASGVGTVALNLGLNGATFGPNNSVATPDNYVQKLVSLWINNVSGSTAKIQIQVYNGTTTVVVAEVSLASKTGIQAVEGQFKLLAQQGYYFQVISDTAASADVYGIARLVKGAGF